ncbi:MAG: cupin domain-containing protein [Thermomicrobiales bacterium]|nr:cupin domain-containing protein [Thermomicrobiales bacterium]
MRVIRRSELVEIETPGGNMGAAVATPSRGASEVSVIRQRQRPGGVNPVHTHDREEVMVVLAGAVRVVVADAAQALGPGDGLILPAGTPHRIENAGEAEAEWLLIAPAGVRFFHANGEAGDPPWAR